ncbi:hypothetical protein PV327_010466 [Microctonus hyperodae]|uniref:Uncharacterized protein n=1 Tax=Microctonus hyperodae TaxID=165561 RepID=A0AA39KUY9_MICHY|nr:hypothetical protein PV327_010466 [Microctonus hyperodae]
MCGYYVTPLKYRFIQRPGKQSQWKHRRTVSRRLIEGEQGALGLKESCAHVMLECALEGDRGRKRKGKCQASEWGVFVDDGHSSKLGTIREKAVKN